MILDELKLGRLPINIIEFFKFLDSYPNELCFYYDDTELLIIDDRIFMSVGYMDEVLVLNIDRTKHSEYPNSDYYDDEILTSAINNYGVKCDLVELGIFEYLWYDEYITNSILNNQTEYMRINKHKYSSVFDIIKQFVADKL